MYLTPMLHHVHTATKRHAVNKSRRFHTSEARLVFKPLQSKPLTNKQRIPSLNQPAVPSSRSNENRIKIPGGSSEEGIVRGESLFSDCIATCDLNLLSSSQAERSWSTAACSRATLSNFQKHIFSSIFKGIHPHLQGSLIFTWP